MRVAIFTDAYLPFTSGVVTHIKILKDELIKNGHEVLIVTASPEVDDYKMEDNVLYCPAVALKKIYGYGITTPISLHRLNIIKEFNPDVIHIQTEFSMGLFGLWATNTMKKPMVYTLHTMYDDYTNYIFPKSLDTFGHFAAHRYFHIIASRADEIIGPSPKVGEFLKRCGVDEEIHVVSNIAHVDEPDEARVNEIRTANGLDGAEVVLCFIGRLGKEKSIDVLMTYFSKALEKHPTMKLFIIGGGPEAENLKALAKTLKIENNVIFTGMIPNTDVRNYLAASDLYATASTSEMNSVSMLEGLSSGLMVLQKLDEANRYQINEGKTGLIFENEEDFCKLIDDYAAKTPQERAELRKSVKAEAEAYGSKEFISKMIEIYTSAINKHNHQS